jgi:TonB family protein
MYASPAFTRALCGAGSDDEQGMQGKIRSLFLASLAVTSIAASVRAAAPTPGQTPVVAGGHEPPVSSAPPPAGDYLKRMHDRIHARWVESGAAVTGPAGPRASRPADGAAAPGAAAAGGHDVTLAIGIRWDGTIAELAVRSSSQSPELDRRALEITRKSAPFPLPPQDIVSDDGYAHVEWTFSRDARGCAAGAHISRVEDPLDVSLPRLIQSNRVPEAMRRVGGAVASGSDAPLDRFARLFLARAIPDPVLDVTAAAALAEVGDRSQIDRLRGGLGSRATATLAARGLARLGVDVCDAVEPTLASGTRPSREIALDTIRGRAGEGVDVATCLPALVRVLGDHAQPGSIRLAALDIIVRHVPSGAKAAIALAMQDKDPAVRGAGIYASVKKGAGRPEMYRLAPMLHDRAVEIRTAASAGIVRAAGDQALDQLYLLARETDPRPGQAVAEELAQLGSPASAELLGKMLKRNNPPVQLAAARALARRKDAAARAQLAELAADLPGQVRQELQAPASASPAGASAGGPAAAAASPVLEPFEALLRQRQEHAAAQWIVAHWIALPPQEGIAALGTWLGRAAGTRSTPDVKSAVAPTPGPAGARTASALP